MRRAKLTGEVSFEAHEGEKATLTRFPGDVLAGLLLVLLVGLGNLLLDLLAVVGRASVRGLWKKEANGGRRKSGQHSGEGLQALQRQRHQLKS